MAWTTCWRCKERFGLDDATEAMLRRSGKSFYCPWGHAAVFEDGKTDLEKAQEEVAELRRQRDRTTQDNAYQLEMRLAAERRASAMKGVATRLKNRVAAGVCPCCNRTFENLQRHMTTKHAGFRAEEVTPEGAVVQ